MANFLNLTVPALRDPTLTRPDWLSDAARPDQALWLDKNENSDPDLAGFTRKLLSEIPTHSLYAYPDSAGLYRKIAAFDGIAPEQILLTPGSDGAIRKVFEAFVQPGDKVIHTLPTFAMYPVYAKMFGATARAVEYQSGREAPELRVEDLFGSLNESKSKLLCLPNPDSPTGTVFSPDDLKKIIEASLEQETVVLVDEAYYPFHDHSCVTWASEYPNLLVARTFAKAWGLAGLRLGYLVGPEELISLIHKLRPMYEASTLAIDFMKIMLDHSGEMRASVDRILEGKQYFLTAMEERGFKTWSTHGNFCYVNFGDNALTIEAALKPNVLYRAVSDAACLRGLSRFTCTTRERFQNILEMIEGAL